MKIEWKYIKMKLFSLLTGYFMEKYFDKANVYDFMFVDFLNE